MEYRICTAILNYNNAPLTVRCLESVLSQEGVPFLPVITDNGSGDDSVAVLIRFFEKKNLRYLLLKKGESLPVGSGREVDIVLIRTGHNGGFSSGSNAALDFAARSISFSHVLLLNNDVVLEKDFLQKMTECYRSLSDRFSNPKLGLSAPEKTMDGIFRHGGIHYLNILSGLVFSRPLFPAFGYLVGACLFLPVDAPKLDEGYFLYYDDAAYSKILLNSGYQLAACPGTGYLHDLSGTTRSNRDLHRIIFASMRRFYGNHYPWAYPIVIALRFLLELVRLRFRIGKDLLLSAIKK